MINNIVLCLSLLMANSQSTSTIGLSHFNISESQNLNPIVPENPNNGSVDSCTSEDGIFRFTNLKWPDQSKSAEVDEKLLIAPQGYSTSNYLISLGELKELDIYLCV